MLPKSRGELLEGGRSAAGGHLGIAMPHKTDQRPREPSVQGTCRERRYGSGLDRAVEGLVVMAESLVVGTIAWLVDVEERDDEAGLVLVPPHAAGRLDVLGVSLRLSRYHHQPQARDVEADRDHVRGQGAVHSLLHVGEVRLEAPPGRRDPVGRNARGELDGLLEDGATRRASTGITKPPTLPAVGLEGV